MRATQIFVIFFLNSTLGVQWQVSGTRPTGRRRFTARRRNCAASRTRTSSRTRTPRTEEATSKTTLQVGYSCVLRRARFIRKLCIDAAGRRRENFDNVNLSRRFLLPNLMLISLQVTVLTVDLPSAFRSSEHLISIILHFARNYI